MTDLVMKIIMDAQDKASAAMQRVRNASHGLSGSLNELEKELKDVANAQKMLEKHSNLRGKMAENAAALDKVRQRQKALTQEVRAAGGVTAKHKEEFAKLGREAERLQEKQNKNRLALKALTAELKQAGVQVGNLKTAQAGLISRHEQAAAAAEKQRAAVERLAKAQARVARAERRVESAETWNERLSTVSGSAAMGAVGMGIGVGLPVIEYAKAETAATELRVAMMNSKGQVAAEFAKVDALANSLGDRLPGTTADFKMLMTMLIRQGVSAETILGGTGEAAALLAVQLKKTPEAAAEMAVKLQDATRSTEKEMMGLMDRVQKLYYMGVDDNNILEAFAKLSPALDVTKMKGEQAIKAFSPLIGMLDQAGLSGGAAGNALRKVFSLAMDTKKINKATKGTGIELDFTNGKGEFGGIEQMYTQLAKLQQLNTEKRLKILKDIFGDDAETLQALNTMIEKGQAGYDEFAAKMEAQASLQQRVNETLGTVVNLWDSATGSFTNFLVAMGEAIAPEIRQIIEKIDIISTKLGAWAKANPETANTILKLAAGIGIALAAFMALAGVVGAVILPMAMMKWAWAQLAFSFVRGSSILHGANLAFGALARGASTAVSALSRGANLAFGALKWLGGAGRIALSALTNGLMWAGRIFLQFGGFAVRAIMMVGRAFLFNPIGLAITAIIGSLYLLWRHWDTVISALNRGWQWLKSVLRDNPFLGALGGPIGLILTLIANWDRMGNSVSAGWQWIKGVLRENPFLGALAGPIGMVASLITNFDRLIAKVQAVKAAFQNFKMPSLPALPTIKPVGFSLGGYTGAGGVNEAAGIVHKGEVVFSQRDVARFGGWQVVDKLRTGGLSALENISGSLKIGNSLGEDNRPKLSGAMPRPKSFSPGFVGGNSGSLNMAGDNITINIHAAPNMDVRQLADLVMQKLNNQQRKQQTRANSRFFDKD